MKPMPKAVKDFLRDAPVCRIATVLPNGSPHVSPVCPVYDGQTMFIDVSHVGGTAKALKSDRRVTVLVDDYYDNWKRLRGVILRTRTREVKGKEKDAAWRRIRRKFPQSKAYGWNPRLTLALRITGWQQWGIVTEKK
jgi:nitroimidazol reductase NimA-like FMN-containing flavoprotein (pyridoxamine 5'-phosphate oxidase superfamily)